MAADNDDWMAAPLQRHRNIVSSDSKCAFRAPTNIFRNAQSVYSPHLNDWLLDYSSLSSVRCRKTIAR